MREDAHENIPDEWIGKRAAIQYKTIAHEPGYPWGVSVIHGVIEEKNDLGLFVRPLRVRGEPDRPSSPMLIAYDALLTVDVTD